MSRGSWDELTRRERSQASLGPASARGTIPWMLWDGLVVSHVCRGVPVHTLCMRQQGITELAELVGLVAAEVISEAEATRRATATDGAWDDDRVLDTVETVHWWLRRGDLRSACVLASLLMTAVERAQPELRQQAALSFVRAATEVVAIDLNGALYRQASDVAERLLGSCQGR